MATTPKESAWEAAHRGWKIFPLRRTAAGKFVPAIKDWENSATSNLETIEAWQERYACRAWGLACEPSGLFALDLDRKSGKNPDRTLDSFPLLPPTFTVKTPTGGEHFIFAGSGPSSVQALGEGLDTRGRGGYVVLYGSLRDDGRYEILDERPPTPAPSWLIEEIEKRAVERAVLPEGVSVVSDSPASIAAAESWIQSAPPAIEGDSGDLQTYRTACRLRDLGVSAGRAFEMLLKFFNPRCVPPWEPDELHAKVANAFRYGKNDMGVASPEAFFSQVEVASCALVDAQTWADSPAPTVDPIIEGLFDAADKVAIIGPSKTRKTFFALQMAFAMASGRPFCGFLVPKPRRILMVNAEVTAKHFHRRLKRVYESYFSMFNPEKSPLGDRFKILNSRGSRLTDETISRLAAEAKADVILLDPLYKLLMGDECDQERVSILLARFDALAAKTGAAVLYVHHDAKGAVGDRATRDRGSGSSLLNRDFDCAFMLSPHADNDDEAVLDVLVRNYPPQGSVGLRFESCTWVCDQEVTLRPETTASRREKAGTWNPFDHATAARACLTEKMSSGKLLEKLMAVAGTERKARRLLELVKTMPDVYVEKEKAFHSGLVITPI